MERVLFVVQDQHLPGRLVVDHETRPDGKHRRHDVIAQNLFGFRLAIVDDVSSLGPASFVLCPAPGVDVLLDRFLQLLHKHHVSAAQAPQSRALMRSQWRHFACDDVNVAYLSHVVSDDDTVVNTDSCVYFLFFVSCF